MDNSKPELARFRHRLFALLADSLFLELFVVAVILGLFALFRLKDVTLMFGLFFLFYYVVGFSLDFVNNVLLVKYTNGKSIGKALFNVRILKEDYTQATLWNIFRHWLVSNIVINALGFLAVIISFLIMRKTPLKQGIHNLLADTIVVKSRTQPNKVLAIWSILIFGGFLLLMACIFFAVMISNNIPNLSLNDLDLKTYFI